MTRMKLTLLSILAVSLGGCSAFRGQTGEPEKPKSRVNFMAIWADAAPDDGVAPLTVTLTAEALTPGVNPSYVWDFADGTTGETGARVTHTFAKPGQYKVRLSGTWEDLTASDEVIVDVEAE